VNDVLDLMLSFCVDYGGGSTLDEGMYNDAMST
jgi:hypothetical protein